MTTLRVLPEARAEAFNAAQWYDAQTQGVGARFLDEFDAVLDAIRRDPTALPIYDTIRLSRAIRRMGLPSFPHLVIVEITVTASTVLAVAHPARKPGYWRNRRP